MGPVSDTLTGDEHWMQLALEDADTAARAGDVPIGAVVVRADGVVLARAGNRREQDSDPTAHAEILALRQASAGRGHWRLHDCTLYVTLEPCLMCAGALVNSRLQRLVYAAHDPKAGAIESLYRIAEDTRLNHRFVWTAGVLESESQERLRAFFRQLRSGS
jgi:tRNA(adenine34) deaminase